MKIRLGTIIEPARRTVNFGEPRPVLSTYTALDLELMLQKATLSRNERLRVKRERARRDQQYLQQAVEGGYAGPRS